MESFMYGKYITLPQFKIFRPDPTTVNLSLAGLKISPQGCCQFYIYFLFNIKDK
jgi:hypothetical protein